MDQSYKEAQSQAMRCENDLKNQLDNKNHSTSRSLLDEARQLVSELDDKKNPRSLEARVKNIQNLLNQAKGYGEEIMDAGHIASAHDNYEDLRRALKEFDNY